MTEIPEHLRKRAEEARAKAAAASGASADAPAAGDSPASDADGGAGGGAGGKIPAHLLERSKAAKAKAEGGEAQSHVAHVVVVLPPSERAPYAAVLRPHARLVTEGSSVVGEELRQRGAVPFGG